MEKAFPILRIDNYTRAREFYVDGLGFRIEWEWRHEPGFPVYMRISRGELALHLTEHKGECSPGGGVYFEVDDVEALRSQWAQRLPLDHAKVQTQPWGKKELKLKDPFDNKLCFSSPAQPASPR